MGYLSGHALTSRAHDDFGFGSLGFGGSTKPDATAIQYVQMISGDNHNALALDHLAKNTHIASSNMSQKPTASFDHRQQASFKPTSVALG